jgi:hypothetical protein
MAWTAPLAHMVRAATANAEGDSRGAAAALRVAIECAAATEMNVHMWCARRQLGCLLGGEEGDRYVAQADAAMQAEGVQSARPNGHDVLARPVGWRRPATLKNRPAAATPAAHAHARGRSTTSYASGLCGATTRARTKPSWPFLPTVWIAVASNRGSRAMHSNKLRVP